MRFTGHYIRLSLALMLAGSSVLGVGCASTKNVMNKATFGLVGEEDNAAREQKRAEKQERKREKAAEKQAKKEAKRAENEPQASNDEGGFWNRATFGLVGGDSEDKTARKEAKRQAEEEKKAQKRAANERKKAEKQARKEDKQMAKAQADSSATSVEPEEPERGLWNKATFGLVGGDSEDKAARKEAKRQAEEEKKTQKRAANEQKKAEKQARKEDKQMAKAQADSSATSVEPEEPERGLWNKATFGLVGGDSEDKAARKEAKRQAEEEKKTQKRAANEQKKAEKQARKEEKQMAKAQADSSATSVEPEEPERGLWNKATFGLVGGDSEDKTARKEAKRQAEEEKKEQKKTEKQARKEDKQLAKAQTGSADGLDQAEEPKRGLMSKLTFGLVGGGDDEGEADQTVEEEMPVSTPEPPVSMPAGGSGFEAQSASALSPDARKLAKLPFETSISYDSMSASGKQQAVASRATYSKHDYGITDLGDVRIAVRDMTFSGGTTGGRIIISSEDRAKASGTAGIGNESFSFDYQKGVTNCTFGTIKFSIEQGLIIIDGRSVPMGQGHRLVVLNEQGSVEGVYDID